MKFLTHKKGDTFKVACTYLDSSGAPADYSAGGIMIKSQVRDQRNRLLTELTVTAGVGTGEFTVRGDTANWPLGQVLWDLQFSQGSDVFSTETATIVVGHDVTQE